MRVGVWGEDKILFKNGGHNHSGGTQGAHIGGGALGTGCLQYVGQGFATNIAPRKIYQGTLRKDTRGLPSAKCYHDITGWKGIQFCRVNSRYNGNSTLRGGGEGSVEWGNCKMVGGAGSVVRVYISGTVATAATYWVNAFLIGW